ncbi:MAG: DNA polymerase IV, partial [Nocardioides sp.]
TLTRSSTLSEPTDASSTVSRLARGLLADLDVSGGVRLLGVGVSGLADWIQDDLFGESEEARTATEVDEAPDPEAVAARRSSWGPGQDVVHDEMGRGWVWGSGRGVVTVRFETAETPAGPVRSYALDDPALHPWSPEVVDPPDSATGSDNSMARGTPDP